MAEGYENLYSMPVGALGIIGMRGCEELCASVDGYIRTWRQDNTTGPQAMSNGYLRDSYLIGNECPRFGTGEAKALITETVRGYDLFIISDCFNHGVTYKMFGKEVPMSPDDHFQDLKRIIGAVAGKARRINVIMTMLYEGRQHRRSSRESLDCAVALQELVKMGVTNLITFDAHDPRVQNAIPLEGFENVIPNYQFIKALIRTIPDLQIDRDHMMIISPDEGAMSRCIYYSSVLNLDLGMFYKRRDYSRVVNGKNPIIAHMFLGDNIEDKDVIIVDDMIATGDSILDIVAQLKARKARRIFVCPTFGLFCEGLDRFDEAYNHRMFDGVYSTNLIYRTPELLSREWYFEVDMSKYIAHIINTLNHDASISSILNPSKRIAALLEKHERDLLQREKQHTDKT
ncbi:MAG: ribose-phosphate pyrophosphokinase [Clostridiales bacterium]|jgi:ribose-phosphate pyrophosphokinase|nr:ribose-phosphate pyrophosphokinase [Clostridiales bacterium]